MLPHATNPTRRAQPPHIVAASLLTSDAGAEVHLFSGDGLLLRLPTDEATARQLIVNLWQALEKQR